VTVWRTMQLDVSLLLVGVAVTPVRHTVAVVITGEESSMGTTVSGIGAWLLGRLRILRPKTRVQATNNRGLRRIFY